MATAYTNHVGSVSLWLDEEEVKAVYNMAILTLTFTRADPKKRGAIALKSIIEALREYVVEEEDNLSGT